MKNTMKLRATHTILHLKVKILGISMKYLNNNSNVSLK